MNSKLIILHGWTYSTEKWNPFLKLLDDRGVRYEMLKIPGLTAPLKSAWKFSDYTSWLRKTLSKRREKVVLIGHSNGGRIAAAFAARYPEKIACLILIDSAGVIHRDIKTLIKKKVLEVVAKTGKKLTKSDSVRNLLYRAIGEQDYNRASPKVKKTMLNLISEDLVDTFSYIIVPTLLIWGEEDSITPLSDGKKINALIKGSELFVVPKAKHSPQFSHPEEVARIVTKFSNTYANL